MARSASCEDVVPILPPSVGQTKEGADDDQWERAIAAALAEAVRHVGDNATPEESGALHRLADGARELRLETAALRADIAEAEAAEGKASETAEELREERAKLIRLCEQLFGLVIGFGGFQRPKAGSWKATSLASTTAQGFRTATAEATAGTTAHPVLLEQLSLATQARDKAKRMLESATKAQKEAEDYVEWVRSDIELLQQDLESRASRLALRLGGSPHVFPARQDGPRAARCLDLEAGLASPPPFQWAVRIGDTSVVRCVPSGADGDEESWPAAKETTSSICVYTGGFPCELQAVARGRTAVTVHRRRKGRGSLNDSSWPLPEDAFLVTVEEGELTRTLDRVRTLSLDRTQSYSRDNVSQSAFEGSGSLGLDSRKASFSWEEAAAASTNWFDGSGTPLWVEVTPREAPMSPEAARWRNTAGSPLEESAAFAAMDATPGPVMQPLTPAGFPPTRSMESGLLPAVPPTPPPQDLRSVAGLCEERHVDLAPTVTRCTSSGSRIGSSASSLISDAEGFQQVAAQFRCADAHGRGVIRRSDLARLLKALDAGEWTDARVQRLMTAIDASHALNGANGGRAGIPRRPSSEIVGTNGDGHGSQNRSSDWARGGQIQYEEFLEWLFGTAAQSERSGSAVQSAPVVGRGTAAAA